MPSGTAGNAVEEVAAEFTDPDAVATGVSDAVIGGAMIIVDVSLPAVVVTPAPPDELAFSANAG